MIRVLLPLASVALLAQTPVTAPAQAAPAKAPTQVAPPRVQPLMPPHAAKVDPEPKETEVLATLGKRTITYGDFKKWIKAAAGPRAAMILTNAASRAQAQRSYLDLQVLAVKARRENLQKTAEFKELQASMEQQALVRILTDETRAGSDIAILKAKAEKPSEADLQAYFEANADRYASPAKFSARHILVNLKPAGGKARTEEEAKERLAKIQAELKAGKKLEDLAKEYSDDPGSKDRGGLYTDITYGRFAKEFEEAVQKQEIGQVGEPVKTQFGFHIIEVTSRTPKTPAEFDKVKETVKSQCINERRARMLKDYVEQARQEVGFHEGPAPVAPTTPAKSKKTKK
jgi:foldase protein PrsA